MKKALSLILAALLLASSMTACGKTTPNETEGGTTAVETNASATEPVATNAPETEASATELPETESPASSYATDKITENGVAMAHIVIAENADQLEKYASEELAYHIRKVSGADISIVNTLQENSLPIIICTPDTLPELETLFPEDLAWLRDTGVEGSTERWGDDGFAIRQLDNKLYIFGATPRGALNGVYDFIEDNLGVIWTRADESIGLVYDEMPTIEIIKADYREKSPFQIRSWTLAGDSPDTQVLLSRNKLNAYACRPDGINTALDYVGIGMEPFITNHNIKWWIRNSPLYDPEEREYWDTDAEGNHVTAENSKQVNYWSEKVVDVIAASVIAFLDTYKESAGLTYVGVCIEDNGSGRVIPEDSQPFEYAPGQFVDPGAPNFESTVFYTCLNKIARKVAEVHPDITIHTYTYNFAEICPECEIEDNIALTVAPILEDLSYSLFDSNSIRNAKIYNNIEEWKTKTTDLFFYNYYGCFHASTVFERPIWDLIKEHLTYYRDSGFRGLVPEGVGEADTKSGWYYYIYDGEFIRQESEAAHSYKDIWAMNSLTFWIYSKLSWNPDENVDALIKTFCDKVYGEASPYMQEYYRLLKGGWEEGKPDMQADFQGFIDYKANVMLFVDYLLFNPNLVEYADLANRMVDALTKAMEAANDVEKERIRYIKENMELIIENFG